VTLGRVRACGRLMPLPVPGRSVLAVFRRAGPCRPAGTAGSLGTAWLNGSARPGHEASRAGQKKNGPRAGLPCSGLHAHIYFSLASFCWASEKVTIIAKANMRGEAPNVAAAKSHAPHLRSGCISPAPSRLFD
jgi:hypothetical protein